MADGIGIGDEAVTARQRLIDMVADLAIPAGYPADQDAKHRKVVAQGIDLILAPENREVLLVAMGMEWILEGNDE